MNILIIGSGGREHALAWKIKQSLKVKNIFVAPGNAGTAQIAKNIPIKNKEEILEWLFKNPVDLVVVGPDDYLADGIVDEIQKMNIAVFGPTRAAAQIEWSKAFAKNFMKENGIPTAKYEVFNEIEKAKSYLEKQKFPIVLKASGLALGKGVIIAKTKEEANDALEKMMAEKIFGDAGSEVVIEEFLEGREISVHAFCDGENVVMFPTSQDHKRIFENDEGPNTGGMGTVAPLPFVTEKNMKEIEEQIVVPTIEALKKSGNPFKGLLSPGVMITKDGPKVIEFNARFGDPETQSYMRLLESDLVDILFACANGKLKEQKIVWSKNSACCVVCASAEYPGNYEKGKKIKGLENNFGEDVVIFHAGTKEENGEVLTNGGRVLGVTTTGKDLRDSLNKAYGAISKISFDGMQFRKDIGSKSL